MAPARPPEPKVIATNRTARRDFDILESVEAGLVLRGSEVKSLREGHVQFADANVWIDGGEAWAMGIHIQPWLAGESRYALDPDRRRKLLLHHDQIEGLGRRQAIERLALVPLRLYWKEGRVKVEIAVARGRRKADKRNVLAERDAQRDVERALARRASGKDATD